MKLVKRLIALWHHDTIILLINSINPLFTSVCGSLAIFSKHLPPRHQSCADLSIIVSWLFTPKRCLTLSPQTVILFTRRSIGELQVRPVKYQLLIYLYNKLYLSVHCMGFNITKCTIKSLCSFKAQICIFLSWKLCMCPLNDMIIFNQSIKAMLAACVVTAD